MKHKACRKIVNQNSVLFAQMMRISVGARQAAHSIENHTTGMFAQEARSIVRQYTKQNLFKDGVFSCGSLSLPAARTAKRLGAQLRRFYSRAGFRVCVDVYQAEDSPPDSPWLLRLDVELPKLSAAEALS